MKICIVTVYNSENCGSFLQANALRLFLEKQGHDVRFLWRKKPKGLCFHLYESIKKVAKIHFWEAVAEWRKYSVFTKSSKLFQTVKLQEIENNIDCVVIGSDTVWNFESSYFFAEKDIFLGRVFHGIKTITYAASIANTPYEMILRDNTIRDSILALKAISVRDEYTKVVVDQITSQDTPVVVDPTLLLDASEYAQMEAPGSERDFILVYYFGKMPIMLQREILRLKEKKAKKLVSFGEYHSWADINVVYDPAQFLYFFHHASIVLTNTFHGTVFSVIYQKQFVDFGTDSNKIVDFLERTGLSGTLCYDSARIESILSKNIDYVSVQKKINLFRQKSIEYLSMHLGDRNL